MDMKIQKAKGTRDLSPAEMTVFRRIEDTFRTSCQKWGYREVRTPTLEYLHLFTSTGTLTPDRLSKVYSFLDWDGWSGERVVLRPDGTIPVARLYVEGMGEQALARLFYVANTFVFEASGAQNRERWQCGIELIGAGAPLADAELISLARDVLGKLGISGVKLRLFHAGIIRALLDHLKLSPPEQAALFDRILDGDASVLANIKAERPELAQALSLLDIKGKSSSFLKNVKSLFKTDLPRLKPALDDFIAITGLLESLGVDYEIDIASGRGFEYYTGLIFQFLNGDGKIGGGGRYDDLGPLLGGQSRPASGVALYLDKLMDLVKTGKPTAGEKPTILVKMEKGLAAAGFALAAALRKAGYTAEFDLGVRAPYDFICTVSVQAGPVYVLAGPGRSEKLDSPAEVIDALKRK